MALSDPYITVEEAVANSASIIPQSKQDPRLRNLMRQWTYLAERRLGFSGLHEKTSGAITVTSLVITKPTDYAIGLDLALFDNSGAEHRWHYRGQSGRIHGAGTFWYNNDHSTTENDNTYHEIGISETAYTFLLDSNGDAITTAKVRYYSYPFDDNGDMLIPEHHLFAIMMFNYWLSLMRDQSASLQDKALASSNWEKARAEAKSKNKIPSPLEGRDLARFWPSMIQKSFNERH